MIGCLLAFGHSTIAQGPLDPPGAPEPNYRTLDQVRPGQPLPSLDPADANLFTLPITIIEPGSYYLTRDLIAPSAYPGPAIVIQTDGVTLDLNGFAIEKRGSPSGSPAIAETDAGNRYVVIRNGRILGPWIGGIDMPKSSRLVLEHLTIQGPLNYGIRINEANRIHNCRVLSAPDEPVAFLGLEAGQALLVTDSEWRGSRVLGQRIMLWRDNLFDGAGVTYNARPFWYSLDFTNNYLGRSIVHKSDFRNITPPAATHVIDPPSKTLFNEVTMENITGVGMFTFGDVNIHHSTFKDITGSAIHSWGIIQVFDSEFSDINETAIQPAIESVILDNSFRRIGTAVGGTLANRLLVMRNHIFDAIYGLQLLSSSFVFDNRISDTVENGIEMGGANYLYRNQILRSRTGIRTTGGANRIDANHISTFQTFGVELGGDNNTVMENRIEDNVGPGLPEAAIYSEYGRNLILDNTLSAVLGVGVQLRDGTNNVIVGNSAWYGAPPYNFDTGENYYGTLLTDQGPYNASRWVNIGKGVP